MRLLPSTASSSQATYPSARAAFASTTCAAIILKIHGTKGAFHTFTQHVAAQAVAPLRPHGDACSLPVACDFAQRAYNASTNSTLPAPCHSSCNPISSRGCGMRVRFRRTRLRAASLWRLEMRGRAMRRGVGILRWMTRSDAGREDEVGSWEEAGGTFFAILTGGV